MNSGEIAALAFTAKLFDSEQQVRVELLAHFAELVAAAERARLIREGWQPPRQENLR